MDSTERQFARLTKLVLDGIATDAERADLSQLSAEHPELVNSVAEELMMDALLKWQSGNINEELPFLDGSVASSHSPPKREKSRKMMPLWTWMVAATVLIATVLSVWKLARTNAIDSVIADIVRQQGVNWSDDSTALAANDTVRRGRLSSTGGEYTLKFRNGSTVRVVGSASLDIKSKMLVHLDHGQATANVPRESIGFTITSAMVDVVDQGTQFGISVDNGRADVVVFDGKVDVKSNLDHMGSQKRLTQGEAVKVDRQGTFDRLMDVRRDVDGRWWSGDRSGPVKHVIASVSDNIHDEAGGGNTFVCYQTTFEGLVDDAIAYSDNPYHQWNGLSADGLPNFLRGADYIRTFNDYRYMKYFEMKVKLARPANLYVFFDDRVEPPEWLKANFEDTGVDIGLDEGPWLLQLDELKQVDVQKYRSLDVNTTAVGGGNSIDNIFSVWRRRCVDGGTISLGDAGDWGIDRVGVGGKGGRAMYGVAATPLDGGNAADKTINSTDGE
jgi:ferric-dicitrate binding protein FerR (iron transport regulator)